MDTTVQEIIYLSMIAASISFAVTETQILKPARNWIKQQNAFLGKLFHCGYCLGHWTAAALVLASGYPLTLVPLHIWDQVWLDIFIYLRLANLPGQVPLLMRTVLFEAFKANPSFAVSLGDVLPLAVLLWPELFEVEQWDAEVLINPGEDYGRLILNKVRNDRPPIRLVVAVDSQVVIKRYLFHLAGCTTGCDLDDAILGKRP